MTGDRKATIDEFHSVVNMSPKELESWLETENSKVVGQKEGNEESTGHRLGRHIVKLLKMKRADYTEDDLAQMKRVISYVHRHSAQQPSGNVTETRWRYSLMNWGHDPLKSAKASAASQASS